MTQPYYQDDAVTIYHGDALAVMGEMDDNSVDLIATDPPYYRIKNEPWDRAWETTQDFLAWIGKLCDEWQRILRPNGSLYCFASPQMRAHVEMKVGTYFACLPTITWDKRNSGNHRGSCKASLRSYFPASEAIIFAEHYSAESMAKGEAGYAAKCNELRGFVFEPLRAYFDRERGRCGISNQEIMDGMEARGVGRYMFARHTFSRSQWQLPTREQYEAARDLFNAFANHNEPRDYLRREYEDLRREYEDLRRPFTVTADVPYTDVWTFATVKSYKGKHPCEKPIDMMEHIVKASSRPGAVVLDCFGGSGTTAHAAAQHGRNAILIESDEKWCRKSADRIKYHVASLYPIEPDTQQLPRNEVTESLRLPLFSAHERY